MLRSILSFVLCGFVLNLAGICFAWHEAGHQIVALIAYEQLSDTIRGQLVETLRKHPRFHEDFIAPTGLSVDDSNKWIFCHAAIWPDLVRGDHLSIPAIPAIKESYDRPSWHFINNPFVLLRAQAPADLRDQIEADAVQHLNLLPTIPDHEESELNVIQAIGFNSNVLKNSHDQAARAVAICWLLHTVGDAHQPLHSVALFSEHMFKPGTHRHGDMGGNSMDFGPDHKTQNLHFLWDDGPGDRAETDFDKVKKRSGDWLADAELLAAGKTAAASADPIEWTSESLEIATQHVYRPLAHQILTAEQDGADPREVPILAVDNNYRSDVQSITKKRVVEAGFRLARRLKESFSDEVP